MFLTLDEGHHGGSDKNPVRQYMSVLVTVTLMECMNRCTILELLHTESDNNNPRVLQYPTFFSSTYTPLPIKEIKDLQ